MWTAVLPDQDHALGLLAISLLATGYRFTAPSPETARRVNARGHNAQASDVTGVFGWSRPFRPDALPPRIFQLAAEAGALERQGDFWQSRYRVSTLAGMSFLHSAYPTLAPDSVFFGPDTYRFARALDRAMGNLPTPVRAADIGCGAGVGGMLVARAFPEADVSLTDINPAALRLARINADAAGLAHVRTVQSDLLSGLAGPFDLIVSNPPYMADAAGRAYRDGGGLLGEGLSLRIVNEATRRLAPGGTLLLYTGAAIIEGENPLLDQAGELLTEAGLTWQSEEIDPDVFGEELEAAGAMSVADRIAVIWLTATKPMTGDNHA